jgi:hypothetical protein
MASSGCPRRLRLSLVIAGLAAAAGCGAPTVRPPRASALEPSPDPDRTRPTEGASATPADPGSTRSGGPGAAARADPGIALPDGGGREILLTDCLGCHDLGGLDLFKGFYGREQWRDLVLTMVAHGAAVDAAEVEELADYLTRYFGPG